MTAACGRADVVVLGHPFFALTDAEGRFRIEGLPPGELNVHAWHPLFREVRAVATASGASEASDVELVIQPRAGAEAPNPDSVEAEPTSDAEEPSNAAPNVPAEPATVTPAGQDDPLI
jgi:hypothetical protein